MSVATLEKTAAACEGKLAQPRALSVDVGYGFTKAVAASGRRAIFPSVVAPDSGDVLGLGGVFGVQAPGYRVRVRLVAGEARSYLVGEAAQASFLASGFLGAEKPADLHDLLLLAAAYLVGAGSAGSFPSQADLVVGLPLAFYRAQKEALKSRLQALSAWVSVDGGEERYISFRRVVVVPQGAGVVFAAQDGLPPHGFAGVVDVGQYTTDYLLVDLARGKPVLDACGSLELGCHLVQKALARAFQEATGEPLPARMEGYILGLVREGRAVPYRGRELDLGPAFRDAVRETAAAIARQVSAAWADWSKFLAATYLAGGGALLLGDALREGFRGAVVVTDPVFANARGYLAALSG